MKMLLIVLVAIAGCMSCQSREQEEIASLLASMFERDTARGDSVYIVEDAVLNWEGNLEGSECNLELLKELFESSYFNKLDIASVFTEEDANLLCTEISRPYTFLPLYLHPQISLVSKERIEKMRQTYEKTGGVEIEVRDEMDKFRYYEKLSKPIFTKNFRYALIYKQSVCFPIPCEGPVLLIYEKKEGKWTLIAGHNFYLI